MTVPDFTDRAREIADAVFGRFPITTPGTIHRSETAKRIVKLAQDAYALGHESLTRQLAEARAERDAMRQRADAVNSDATQEEIVQNLREWGENSPDPDFFQGPTLEAVLSSCTGAATLIEHLSAQIAEARAEATRLLVPNPCSVCGGPITARDGKFIGSGDGSMRDGGSFAHGECYHRFRAEAAEAEVTRLSALLVEAANIPCDDYSRKRIAALAAAPR